MNSLSPTPHEDFLKRRFPNGGIPVNFKADNENQKDGIMESRTNDSGGGNMSGNYITKEMFEQFEKRIDDKLDSLPDRMADKMDAKISKFEAKQTKWFVGIGITLIGTFLKVFGII
ncbi:hypothetical protein [Staphylococcus simulans]|uniref:hypothetical protein n=1 Tax=Staphylococcus simulans TaxID=1286 RepID=UPI001F1F9061|nr:hypothetical protein [Staphylococcus simulans]